MCQIYKIIEEGLLIKYDTIVQSDKIKGDLLNGRNAVNGTFGRGGSWVVDLSSGSGEEAEAEGVDVEKEILADELVGGGERDGVEVVEEAVEAAGLGG